MYKTNILHQSNMHLDNKKEGETIEQKVVRLVQNKEPIKDGVPIIYTDRKEGVNSAYNIRTDRWEIAVDALDRLAKSKEAKRDEIAKTAETEMKVVKDNKVEPLHGEAS
ncbi:MAG: hypothetical protein [Microviridae sp.]|nr:MAG: hypothetical protein [Microviridae sp.]